MIKYVIISKLWNRSKKSLLKSTRHLNIHPNNSGLNRVMNIVNEDQRSLLEHPRIKVSSLCI